MLRLLSSPDVGFDIVKKRDNLIKPVVNLTELLTSIVNFENLMKCQKCNKHMATIHLTEIVEGKRNEMHLCQDCAQDEGVAIKNQVPLNELLSSLLAAGSMDDQPGLDTGSDLDASQECDLCGMSWDKFKKSSLLGCPNDYEVFSSQLDGIISGSHEGNKVHVGKTPSKADESTKRQVEFMSLKKQLEQALRKEDYETAAQLRDQIQEMGFKIG